MSDVDPGVDVHTGAWRRARFEEELGRHVSSAHRAHQPLSVLYVDVDELISQVAELISREVDGRGPLGRVGGGAFAVVVENFTDVQAVQLAERIRRTISVRLSTGATRVTVSVGVATLRPSEPWGNLLEAAELACTRAKQGGRNLVAAR